MNDLVHMNSQAITAFTNQSGFESAQRMAKALITSTMVPKVFQGQQNIGNAIVALELAQRLNASPLMVMQNIHVIHGKPGWSAKFLIATFNKSGRFSAIRYRWKGERGNMDYGCQAYATEKATGNEIEGPWIDWNLVKAEKWDSKDGSKWKTMADKMFMYRSAAWMIDLYAPEISMGLPSTEEIQDIIDINPETGEIIGEPVQQSVADEINARISEVSQAQEEEPKKSEVDPNQLIRIVETAQDTDTLDEVEDLANALDKRSKGYKAIHHHIEAKRKQMAL